ncbi:unnamed protein product [Camellia sinensis]
MAGPGKVRHAASSKVPLPSQQAAARIAAPTQHAPPILTPSIQSVPSTNALSIQPTPPTNATTTQVAPSTNATTTQVAPSTNATTQVAPSTNATTTHDVPSTTSLRTRSRQVRGQTRGKSIARLIANNGGKKLPVWIPADAKVPVGPYATPFANELGLQIRMAAPIIGIKKWDKIDEIHKAPIIQAVRDKFEIVDYDEDEEVRKGVNKKCKTLYRSWRNKMKTHYSKLVDAGVDPYSKPYKGVDSEAWVYMINHVWLDEDYQNLAKKARDSRARLPYNHTMGSKSFQAAMYKQGTEKTDFVDFYKDSHWSKRKSDWVAPICGQLHEALKKRHDESLEPGAIPLTQEQLSIEILGKKSGYLKGFGVGPKPSSSRSSVTAQAHTEVVSSLQKELESLKNLSEIQQEQIAAQNLVAQEQAKMIEMQNKRFEEIEKFMRMTKDQGGMQVDENNYSSEESY